MEQAPVYALSTHEKEGKKRVPLLSPTTITRSDANNFRIQPFQSRVVASVNNFLYYAPRYPRVIRKDPLTRCALRKDIVPNVVDMMPQPRYERREGLPKWHMLVACSDQSGGAHVFHQFTEEGQVTHEVVFSLEPREPEHGFFFHHVEWLDPKTLLLVGTDHSLRMCHVSELAEKFKSLNNNVVSYVDPADGKNKDQVAYKRISFSSGFEEDQGIKLVLAPSKSMRTRLVRVAYEAFSTNYRVMAALGWHSDNQVRLLTCPSEGQSTCWTSHETFIPHDRSPVSSICWLGNELRGELSNILVTIANGISDIRFWAIEEVEKAPTEENPLNFRLAPRLLASVTLEGAPREFAGDDRPPRPVVSSEGDVVALTLAGSRTLYFVHALRDPSTRELSLSYFERHLDEGEELQSMFLEATSKSRALREGLEILILTQRQFICAKVLPTGCMNDPTKVGTELATHTSRNASKAPDPSSLPADSTGAPVIDYEVKGQRRKRRGNSPPLDEAAVLPAAPPPSTSLPSPPSSSTTPGDAKLAGGDVLREIKRLQELLGSLNAQIETTSKDMNSRLNNLESLHASFARDMAASAKVVEEASAKYAKDMQDTILLSTTTVKGIMAEAQSKLRKDMISFSQLTRSCAARLLEEFRRTEENPAETGKLFEAFGEELGKAIRSELQNCITNSSLVRTDVTNSFLRDFKTMAHGMLQARLEEVADFTALAESDIIGVIDDAEGAICKTFVEAREAAAATTGRLIGESEMLRNQRYREVSEKVSAVLTAVCTKVEDIKRSHLTTHAAIEAKVKAYLETRQTRGIQQQTPLPMSTDWRTVLSELLKKEDYVNAIYEANNGATPEEQLAYIRQETQSDLEKVAEAIDPTAALVLFRDLVIKVDQQTISEDDLEWLISMVTVLSDADIKTVPNAVPIISWADGVLRKSEPHKKKLKLVCKLVSSMTPQS